MVHSRKNMRRQAPDGRIGVFDQRGRHDEGYAAQKADDRHEAMRELALRSSPAASRREPPAVSPTTPAQKAARRNADLEQRKWLISTR